MMPFSDNAHGGWSVQGELSTGQGFARRLCASKFLEDGFHVEDRAGEAW